MLIEWREGRARAKGLAVLQVAREVQHSCGDCLAKESERQRRIQVFVRLELVHEELEIGTADRTQRPHSVAIKP